VAAPSSSKNAPWILYIKATKLTNLQLSHMHLHRQWTLASPLRSQGRAPEAVENVERGGWRPRLSRWWWKSSYRIPLTRFLIAVLNCPWSRAAAASPRFARRSCTLEKREGNRVSTRCKWPRNFENSSQKMILIFKQEID